MHEILFRSGLRPDLAGGAHNAPSHPLIGWGGRCPLLVPHPIDAYVRCLDLGAFGRLEPFSMQISATLTTDHDII